MSKNKNAPIVVLEASKQPFLSIGTIYGAISFNGQKYTYIKAEDALNVLSDSDDEKAYKAAHAAEWFGTNVNVDEIQVTEDNSEWNESSKISPMIEIDNDEE